MIVIFGYLCGSDIYMGKVPFFSILNHGGPDLPFRIFPPMVPTNREGLQNNNASDLIVMSDILRLQVPFDFICMADTLGTI